MLLMMSRLSFLPLVTCLVFVASYAFSDELSELKEKAANGNAEAQLLLGYCYTSGQGVIKDPLEAVKWYRKAADQENAKAQLLLGSCYASGQGVAKDLVEAARWCRKAAVEGDGNAQLFLGTCYASGRGLIKDYVQSFAWLSLAAASGNEGARKSLPGIKLFLTPGQKAEGIKLARELEANIKKK